MSYSDPICDHGLVQSQTAHAESLLNRGEPIDYSTSLPNTLAAAHALIQQQQRVIAQLSQQLHSQQTQLARQEQEQLQSARLLEQTQANCQDLRVRLKRQQQQALQFKAALEQCIDSSAHKHAQPEAAESFAKAALNAALEATAPSRPEQPIQPWSIPAAGAAFYSQPTTDKLAALSAPQSRQSAASRPQRSAFAQIDLPTFPRR